jgi:hypothetical protein
MRNELESGSAIQLTSMLVDATLQPRVGGLDAKHVEELQETPESWPPLVVVQQDGKYILVDGFHRYAAAQNLELDSIPVKVIEAPADGDLFSLAFALNAVHGRPLTLSDRRAFAERLLQQSPEWADREIGRRCGLSQPTVAAVRSRLEKSAHIEQPETRVGAGGYIYTVGTNQKQRQPGELPEPGLIEGAMGAVSRVFSSTERVQQRRISQYLQRLRVALEDGDNLDGWENPEDAAEACRLAMGAERAKALAEELGFRCQDVLNVAVCLGYEGEAD